MPQAKALVLFSGGLDSTLAAKVLEEQGVRVTLLCFDSIFFSCAKAKKIAANFGWKLKIIDISQDILDLVKNPPSGYGQNLNPCLDCHALMIKKAGEYLTPNPLLIRRGSRAGEAGEVYDLIATGEVLGQRPFSQNREALARIAKLAGVEILRPLSAKLLPPTQAERNGLVNRHRLLDIAGRSRARQLKLVEKYKIKEYSSPAGGCLLTDQEFSQRLIKMLDNWLDCSINDVELLKYGRAFWLNADLRGLTRTNADKDADLHGLMRANADKVLVMVGRNKEENERLEKTAQKNDIILELKDEMGPTTVVRNSKSEILNSKQIQNSKFPPATAWYWRAGKIQNILEIKVPDKLKMSELKIGEEKSGEEIINLAALLTGYYATKARGKKVKVELKSKI